MHSKRISDTFEDLLHNRWVKLKNLKFAGFKDSDGNLKHPLLSDRLYKRFMEKLYSTKTWSLRNWPHSTKTLCQKLRFQSWIHAESRSEELFHRHAMWDCAQHVQCHDHWPLQIHFSIDGTTWKRWLLHDWKLSLPWTFGEHRARLLGTWESWQYHSRNWVKVFQVFTEIWALIIKYHVKKPF